MCEEHCADGFRTLHSPAGYRVRFQPPPELDGILDAVLHCRGPLLDGSGGTPERIRSRLREAHDAHGTGTLIAPWQVHGTAIAQARAIWALPQRVKADGLHLDPSFGGEATLVASLRFADCTPVLLASAHPSPWAVMLHSGFLGTTRDIFSAAWRRVISQYGNAADPQRTHVWIGPAIGPCCYTRHRDDPTTRQALSSWDSEHYSLLEDAVRFDLAGQIAGRATAAGIPARNIHRLALCTRCRHDLFYSYRAGDVEDRMILLTKIKMPQTPRDL